ERVPPVRADAVDPFAQVDAVQADAAVDLVALEADEGQRADIDLAEAAVGLLHAEDQLQGAGGGGLVAEAVLVVLGGDVAGEGVEAVGPPEAGPVVAVEREDLLGEGLAAAGADGEVAVQDVEDLCAVLHEEAVADAPVADAVADDEVVGAVDGEPAV